MKRFIKQADVDKNKSPIFNFEKMGENLCSLSKYGRQKEKTALGGILSKLVKLDTLKMSKVIFCLTFAMSHDNLTAIKSSLLPLDK